MSTNDIENAYKEMLNQQTNLRDQDAASAARSLADEVIDTVVAPTEARKKLKCPNCESTEFAMRSSLGSTKVHVCVKCNTKVYGLKKSIPRAVPVHSQGKGRGPYYSAPGKEKLPTKNLPKYKLKSKPRKKDE